MSRAARRLAAAGPGAPASRSTSARAFSAFARSIGDDVGDRRASACPASVRAAANCPRRASSFASVSQVAIDRVPGSRAGFVEQLLRLIEAALLIQRVREQADQVE